MKTSETGINLIKEFESLRLKAYLCSAKVWTIGYGHTKGVKKGDAITQDQAIDFLKEDLSDSENAVNSQNLVINQNQFDALVSFVFNIGAGAFKSSTRLRKAKINISDPTIANEFAKWNKATVNGKKVILNGLARRRKAESDLYFKK